jgi:hypothetical protein
MSETARFEDRSLDGTIFRKCSMRRASFEDVALSDARYDNVNLQGARFRDVNMSGVSIDDANINGMTICGHDVQALIRHYKAGAGSDATSDGDANGSAKSQTPNGTVFRNCSMRGSSFEDVALSDARYDNVDLQRARFRDVNMSGVSIDDAKINGMTICGHDVQALIRHYKAGSESGATSDGNAEGSVNATPPTGTESARAFLPSKDFMASKAFYEALGFPKLLDSDVAIFGIGNSAFILQQHFQKDWAENCMMQLMVDDLDKWWRHIDALDLPKSFGVPAPKAPAVQPWGLRVAFLVDPSGVLWHIAQRREKSRSDHI